MEITISLDEKTEAGKKVLKVLNELHISYSSSMLSPKDVAFGIGRKATDEEMSEYLMRCLNSDVIDIDGSIDED
jgi:hypothetical protein